MSSPTSGSALEAIHRNLSVAIRVRTVQQVLDRRAISAVYQPIVQLRDAAIVGHESLARGPRDTAFHAPDDLFRAATLEGLGTSVEKACLVAGIEGWRTERRAGRLFLNLSAQALVTIVENHSVPTLITALESQDLSGSSLVVEITEHERVGDMDRLVAAADELAAQGVRFALDDFGDGRSSLRLWAELRPEFVKIDKYFIRDIQSHAAKVQTLRGIRRLAETFNTVLVAEGIETQEELRVVRDLGIEFGQGYLLGRPAIAPIDTIPREVASTLHDARISVLPDLRRATDASVSIERITITRDAMSPTDTVDEVVRVFSAEPSIRIMAVVDDDKPVALLNRQAFVDAYSRPFFKEIFGRKSCMTLASHSPLLLDKRMGLDAMTAVLTSNDQRYLTDGFIVTDNGRYFGLGSGEQLVRVVTESRIEAARHANPLTFLPGNIPISEHVGRLLDSGSRFVACYADLNHFKAFNDHYGYWRGDEMIKLVARTLVAHCDPLLDFIGHVGGDDFVVAFQSEDWKARAERIVDEFDAHARTLYDEDALHAGGIVAEDRDHVPRFFPFTTLSIGAIDVAPGTYTTAEQVASTAASAKHAAKARRVGVLHRGSDTPAAVENERLEAMF